MKDRDIVQLTETAKITPFWRSDSFRNAIGTVIGQPRWDGSLTVRMVKRGGGLPKVFYINPTNLIPYGC